MAEAEKEYISIDAAYDIGTLFMLSLKIHLPLMLHP